MGTVGEVANALVSPANKLLDGIQKALGKMYEPRHLRKMADAQAYQIKKIGETLRENSDIPIEYNSNGISLSSSDYDEFVKRTQGRLAFQELRKQENIETVAGKALNLLEGKPEVEREPVDIDWLVKFFNSVESIGNEEMQDLWAKLLAGEIQNSGTFSLRTMDKLCCISQNEAKVFQSLLGHCLCTHGTSFILHGKKYKDKYSYDKIRLMNECGLIDSNELLATNLSITFAFPAPILWSYNNVIYAKSKKDIKDLKLPIYPLTQVGKELSGIIGFSMPTAEIEEIASFLAESNPDIEFKVKKVMGNNNGQISFEPDDEMLEKMGISNLSTLLQRKE